MVNDSMNDGDDLWYTGPIEQRRVQTSRGPLEYVDIGQGTPVLYFHGNDCGNDAVVMMEKTLLDDGCRLIAINRPGYYGTPLSCGRSPGDCADLGAELLDQLGIRRAVVIGTSAGGAAASQFASRHHEQTLALVMQCALAHPFDDGRWMPRGTEKLLPVFRHVRFFRPLLRFGHWMQGWKLARGKFADNCMSKERYAQLRDSEDLKSLEALMTKSILRCSKVMAGVENDWTNWTGPRWLEPGSVHCPTLLLHDRADAVVKFAHAEWARECIPNAELCELEVGGHLIWVGPDREKMRRERAAFIRRNAPAPA